MHPRHATDGFVISGSIAITPPLNNDEADLLQAISMVSFRSAVEDAPSAFLAKLAPGHPEGPSGWLSCEDGCCLEIDERGYVRIDAIEPWLAFIVGTLLADHALAGSLMLWDCADRTFTALTVDGTRVRRRAVLQHEPARRSRAGTTALPQIRSV